MLKELRVRAPSVQSLQLLYQVLELSSEPFGTANVKKRFAVIGDFLEFRKDFPLT